MKNLYLFIFLFSFNSLSANDAYSKVKILVREQVVKYDFNPENTIKFKAEVGQNVSINPTDLATLKGLKIHHIDLVYTSYKGSGSFNQDQLNQQRISKLRSALPQVVKDRPTWKYIEQTGAKNLKQAKTYFHGFIVHYGPALDYQHLKTFFKPFQAPPKTFRVNGTEGGEFDCGDGSLVSIGSNSVTYSDGTPVKGPYTLKYTEYKNPADILFSGIPMTYNNGKESLNFSSVGMYDLRAVQNGKPLELSEPAEVDFSCTKPEKDVGFYQMDDKTGEWVKKKDVTYEEPLILKSRKQSTLEFDGIEFELKSKIYNQYSVIQFNESSWDWIFKHFATHPELKTVLEKIDETGRRAQTTVEPKELMDMVIEIMIAEKKAELIREMEKKIALEQQKQKEWEEKERQRIEEEREKMRKLREEQQALRAEISDRENTYPALVSGLDSPQFGVYNCDQIYQMEQPLALSPTYVDENGKEITNKHVVCVMDLNFNGSISFHPNNITCNGKGKNVIVLFTDDKSVYILSEEKFNQLDLADNFRPVFEMKNMTSVIKTSDDLKQYLKI